MPLIIAAAIALDQGAAVHRFNELLRTAEAQAREETSQLTARVERAIGSLDSLSRGQLELKGELGSLRDELSDLESRLESGLVSIGSQSDRLAEALRVRTKRFTAEGKGSSRPALAASSATRNPGADERSAEPGANVPPDVPGDVPDCSSVISALDPARERLLEDARRLLAAGDVVQGQRTLVHLLSVYPNDPEASLMLARSLIDTRPEDPSVGNQAALLAAAALVDPALAGEGHALLAEVARYSGDVGTAEAEYRTAVALSPGVAAYQSALGAVLSDEKKWQQAAQHLEHAIAEDGGDISTRYLHAIALSMIGETRRAADELARLAEENPSLAGAAQRAGELYSRVEDHAQAVKWLSTAARERPSWKLLRAIGLEELAAGRADRAVARLEGAERLLRDDPGCAREDQGLLLRDLARALEEAGDRPAALRAAERAVDADSGTEPAELKLQLER
ncbi:tetratricopeptide repeat protein [Salinispira pacifica]